MEYREIDKSASAGKIEYEGNTSLTSPTCECTCECACFCNCFDALTKDLDLVENDLELSL